jgi:Tfp pilus assembly protein PilV
MRHGVSILEVMFAILVTAIGLLGALTVFPVASMIARKGKVADM